MSLTIHRGEFVAIMGQSGSGKSTLMNIIGCLDRPTSGSYLVLGKEAAHLSPDERRSGGRLSASFSSAITFWPPLQQERMSRFRRSMPGCRNTNERSARGLLERPRLGDRTDHRPAELSGGQQQRAAIARAGERPAGDSADEPAGALDRKSGEEVLALLKELHAEGARSCPLPTPKLWRSMRAASCASRTAGSSKIAESQRDPRLQRQLMKIETTWASRHVASLQEAL